MDLSIIIVNWETREYLRGCLKSIFKMLKAFRMRLLS